MRLTLRIKVFVILTALTLSFIGLSLFALNRFMKTTVSSEVAKGLQRSQQAYERFTTLNADLLASKARALAEIPRLKAVLNIPNVDPQTIYYTAHDLYQATDVDLMLILNTQGEFLSDASDTDLTNQSIRSLPGIEQGLNGTEYTGFWLTQNVLYQIFLSPIVLGDQMLGILALGKEQNTAAAEQIREVTGRDAFILNSENILGLSTEHPAITSIAPTEITTLIAHLKSVSIFAPFPTTLGTMPCLAHAIPIKGTSCSIILFRTLDEIEAEVAAFQISILLLGLFGFALALVFSAWVSGRISAPIRELSEATELFGAGKLEKRVPVRSNDELGDLAWAFNLMANNITERSADLEAVNTMLQKEVEERKRADEALHESEARLRALVENTPDGICLIGTDRQLMASNPVARDYLTTLCSSNPEGIITDIGGQPLEAIETLRARGLSHEVIVEEPAHQIFEIGTSAISQQGGWVVVIRDITKEREVQDKIQQQERLAAVGQLAAGISHDFNNLLTGINGFAQLLTMRPDIPDSAKDALRTIDQQGQRAAQLIRQILDFSRKSAVKREPVSLVPLMEETIKLLERTLPETIDIRTDFDQNDHMIMANITQLQQVLTNLGVNARDAMPEGGIFQIKLLSLNPLSPLPDPEMEPGNWTVITLKDTGTGIPPNVLEHIFEPFFTTKAPGSGTGLGLAQVYGIVKQHEGFIDVQSQVGQGTTFTIYLPQAPETEQTEPSTQQEFPKGHGETILVVEDEKTVRIVAQTMLETLNYQVLIATNGKEALARYRDHHNEISLVLTDIVMPEMGGLELYRHLKKKNPNLPILVMSGYPVGNDEEETLSYDSNEYLEKPLNLNQLGHKIKETLQRHASKT